MAYRQDFAKHLSGLIGIWKLAINKKHKYHLLGFKKSSSSIFVYFAASVSFLSVSCRHIEDAQYFMLWSTLNFVDQLQNHPSKHLKSNALDSTSEHFWKVIPIFSQYFPHIVLPQSSKQIQRSSCCGSMDARHAVTSTCMWQYAVALNVRSYPNIMWQYAV